MKALTDITGWARKRRNSEVRSYLRYAATRRLHRAEGFGSLRRRLFAAPGIVRPLAPLQTIEIACAEFCAATSKPSVAEQSTSPKRKLRRQPRENASKIGVPDVSGGHIAPV